LWCLWRRIVSSRTIKDETYEFPTGALDEKLSAFLEFHSELTEREAEVLTWIARGKGNYEIGVILGARQRTICKYVEHILAKLNVENRTAAAPMAFTVCSQLFDLF